MRWRHRTLPAAASLCLDLMAGGVSAVAGMLVIAFLSPPLPLHSPTCATGHNDPANLLVAGVLLVIRWVIVAYVTKPPPLPTALAVTSMQGIPE